MLPVCASPAAYSRVIVVALFIRRKTAIRTVELVINVQIKNIARNSDKLF